MLTIDSIIGFQYFTFQKIGKRYFIINEIENKKNPKLSFPCKDSLNLYVTLWLMDYRNNFRELKSIKFKKL